MKKAWFGAAAAVLAVFGVLGALLIPTDTAETDPAAAADGAEPATDGRLIDRLLDETVADSGLLDDVRLEGALLDEEETSLTDDVALAEEPAVEVRDDAIAQDIAALLAGSTSTDGVGDGPVDLLPSVDDLAELSDEATSALATTADIRRGVLPEPTAPTSTLGADAPALGATGVDGVAVELIGPAGWRTGDPIDLALRVTEGEVRALEAAVVFDETGVEAGGFHALDAGVDTIATVDDGVVALGALSCVAATCGDDRPGPVDDLHLRFVPLTGDTAGHRITVSAVRVVTADGRVVALDDLDVQVGDTGSATSPRAWEPAAATVAAEAPTVAALDHNLDGGVNRADVAEAIAAWYDVRAAGDPCNPRGLDRLARHDLNGDGCIDVVDLRTLLDSELLQVVPSPLLVDGLTPVAPTTSGAGSSGLVPSFSTVGPTPALSALAGNVDFDPYTWDARTGATTFTVDSVADDPDANIGNGVCATAAGACTLRAAIHEANADAGPNRIEFAIPGGGVHTIDLDDRLPAISDITGGLTIDGYTQSGAAANDDDLTFAGDIRIELEGEGLRDFDAFYVTSAENVIRGVSAYAVRNAVRLEGTGAVRNHVVGNVLGTNVDNSYRQIDSGGRGVGVFINGGAKFNVVGTPVNADRNHLTGGNWSIRIDGGGSDGNLVWNNIMGLTGDGSDRMDTRGGIDVQWAAQYNVIGGTNPGERNVISGNRGVGGIDFSHNAIDNYAIGNHIGTSLDGATAPAHAANSKGVALKDDAHKNYVIGNVIANSQSDGIWSKHRYNGRNTILDNYIGLTATGEPAGNGNWGIWLTGHDEVIEHNVIAHNDEGGVYISNYNGGGSTQTAGDTIANRLTANVFYDNGGMGIDIAPVGQNTNDAGDADAGPNGMLNHPTFVTVAAGRVVGDVCGGCQADVYLADEDDALQGQVHLGTVTADGAGRFSLDSEAIEPGRLLTAVAIDTANNTSEFSPVESVPGAPTGTPLPTAGSRPAGQASAGTGSGRLEVLSTSVDGDWNPVTFAGAFNAPIPVCSQRYENNTEPTVIRIRNLTADGMELRLQVPGDGATAVGDVVDCVVAETGSWTLPDGTAMEARAVDVAGPSWKSNWGATQVPLLHGFDDPMALLSQVITTNDDRWSTAFARRGSSRSGPPLAASAFVGYHVGEDTDRSRAAETVGVIVFDVTGSELDGVPFETGRTGDVIRSPQVATHALGPGFDRAPEVGVVSQVAMDGNDGSWVVMTGAPTASGIALPADEDTIANAERGHTTEQADYAVFGRPLVVSVGIQPRLLAWDDFERESSEFWGVAPFGGAWQPLLNGNDARDHFATDGAGQVEVEPGFGYEALLDTVHQRDIDTVLVVTTDAQPTANTDINVQHRRLDAGTFYRGRARLQADGSIRVQIVRADGGSYASLAVATLPGLTYTAGDDLAIRMQTTGDGTSTIRIKVWAADQPEPGAWSLTTTDTTPSLQGPGSMSLRFQVAGSAGTPLTTFSVDEVLAVDATP
ncbi:MAG: right-handed parallel beta-helix repeat-containing protein [Actinomycetota bacterium]